MAIVVPSTASSGNGGGRRRYESSNANALHIDTLAAQPLTRRRSQMSTTTQVVLEPAAQEFVDATANPPYLFDLGPIEGRKVVDEVQSGEIDKPDVEIQDTTIPGGPAGVVSIRILRPRDATEALPVILYAHGAGWVFGNAHTHDR